MKRFKVEKSRSSLWREAKNDAIETYSDPEDYHEEVLSDAEGLVESEVCFLSSDAENDSNMAGANLTPVNELMPILGMWQGFKNPGFFFKKPSPVGFLGFIGYRVLLNDFLY